MFYYVCNDNIDFIEGFERSFFKWFLNGVFLLSYACNGCTLFVHILLTTRFKR